jgi:hypothetical protein
MKHPAREGGIFPTELSVDTHPAIAAFLVADDPPNPEARMSQLLSMVEQHLCRLQDLPRIDELLDNVQIQFAADAAH